MPPPPPPKNDAISSFLCWEVISEREGERLMIGMKPFFLVYFFLSLFSFFVGVFVAHHAGVAESLIVWFVLGLRFEVGYCSFLEL